MMIDGVRHLVKALVEHLLTTGRHGFVASCTKRMITWWRVNHFVRVVAKKHMCAAPYNGLR